jgi:geranylgeranyl diphosphate synthase type I
MSLQDFIKENKPLIEKSLIEFFDQKNASNWDKLTKKVLQDLCDFTLQGKMLRGNFVLLAHNMYEGKNKNAALRIAAALEINQSGLLIHDDIMDNDRTRRGQETIFVKYEKIGLERKAINKNQYGLSMGILFGDAAFFLSYNLISQLDIDPKVLQKIIHEYSLKMLVVAHGQLLDFDYGQTENNQTEDEILNMYLRKTSSYSFVLPFILGALLAGAQHEELDILKDLGKSLGIIFQIKDDEIGLFGDEKKTGKPVGSDVRENKKTFARFVLYSKANPEEKIFLDKVFGNSSIKKEDVEKIITLAKRNNVNEVINNKIQQYVSSAEESVNKLTVSEDYKKILHELIQYLLHRDK